MNIQTRIGTTSIISWIDDWLVCASLRDAINGIGRSLIFYALMDLQHNPFVLGISFTLAAITYGYDRVSDYADMDDQANHEKRTQWISTNLLRLKLFLGGNILLLLLLLLVHPIALVLILPSLGFTLCYSKPILPGKRAPKQLPGIKAFYTAFFWVVLTVYIPALIAGVQDTSQLHMTGGFIFCCVSALVNLNDIEDVEGDTLVGTRSLPVVFGCRLAYGVSSALFGTAVLFSVGLSNSGGILFAVYLATITAIRPHWVRSFYYRYIPTSIIGWFLISLFN